MQSLRVHLVVCDNVAEIRDRGPIARGLQHHHVDEGIHPFQGFLNDIGVGNGSLDVINRCVCGRIGVKDSKIVMAFHVRERHRSDVSGTAYK